MAVYKKDPNATLDYSFDWTAYLTPIADTIASVTWELGEGLAKISQSNNTMMATAFISGGVLGEAPLLTCRIVTAGGRIDDRSITLKIVNR